MVENNLSTLFKIDIACWLHDGHKKSSDDSITCNADTRARDGFEILHECKLRVFVLEIKFLTNSTTYKDQAYTHSHSPLHECTCPVDVGDFA